MELAQHRVLRRPSVFAMSKPSVIPPEYMYVGRLNRCCKLEVDALLPVCVARSVYIIDTFSFPFLHEFSRILQPSDAMKTENWQRTE